MALLDVTDLRTWFHTRAGVVRAVDGVSFSVEPGGTLGIVGESGSGKSVACYSFLGLLPSPPARVESGSARFDGMDLLRCSAAELRAVRGKRISMIFQDPMTALNPYLTVGRQVMEPLEAHGCCSHRGARDRAAAMLAAVGLPDAPRQMRTYPHEFSGGMRQRVMIAMALVTRPDLVIADEPTTALDVTVQAQILALIKQMQADLGMAVILVTHNLGVIAGTCDTVLVMYAGRFLEAAETRRLFREPRHPYTRALLAALPGTGAKGAPLYTIPGMPPDPVARLAGCPFAPRCRHTVERCRREPVALREVAPGHQSACLRVQAGEL